MKRGRYELLISECIISIKSERDKWRKCHTGPSRMVLFGQGRNPYLVHQIHPVKVNN